MDLLIVGSVATDDVRTPHGQIEKGLGGSAVYSSVAASYFCSPAIVGVVGEDFEPTHVSLLKNKGVDVSGLERKPGLTFHWKGYYEGDMNSAHTLDTQLNVFASFDPHLDPEAKQADFVFLANIDPSLQLHVLQELEKPAFVLLDTMNFWITHKKEALLDVIAKVDMVVVNDGEARQLTGCTNLLQAAQWIQTRGPKGVIIKKGEHGALVFWQADKVIVPAFPLETVVDPTGAGDTFAGAFIGYLAQTGKLNMSTLHQAAAVGTILASFVVEDFSVKKSAHLTTQEISRRFAALKQMTTLEPLEMTPVAGKV